MNGRLKNKAALITGAASNIGIGFATARLFAAEGARVFITDIDGSAIEQATAEIRSAGGLAFGSQHDVRDARSWQLCVADALEKLGQLDILVNNAGIAHTQSILDIGLDDYENILAVNLRGTFLGCRTVIPYMRKTGGSIVNTSSVAGMVGVRMNAIYAASKGAVCLFTKSLALEEAPNGIRCNSVHPGVIDTALTRTETARMPGASETIRSAIPLGRAGTPVDVAHVSLFLASDDASYITGAEFVVDGGYTAQ